MMVGRIDGQIDGRPFHVEAQGLTLRVGFDSLRDAWRSRKALRSLTGIGKFASLQFNVKVELADKRLGTLAVLPEPHWLVRPFL